METVKYYEETEYSWECPECDSLNETVEDLAYVKFVTCDDCGKEFKPEPS